MLRLPAPTLDRSADTALADQIAAFYRTAIRGGQLRAGDRLPPIREIAEAAGVTRAVVADAYRQLSDAGLVAGEVGRGTTVLASKDTAAPHGPLSSFAEAALLQQQTRGAFAVHELDPAPAGRAGVAGGHQIRIGKARIGFKADQGGIVKTANGQALAGLLGRDSADCYATRLLCGQGLAQGGQLGAFGRCNQVTTTHQTGTGVFVLQVLGKVFKHRPGLLRQRHVFHHRIVGAQNAAGL